jgi:hypothetical protein
MFLDHVRHDPDLGIKVACASSLGKLKVTEATSDLLEILYIDSYPQSRREMGLSLARLLDAEAKYIELSRRLDEDPGTALAREMESLRNLLKRDTLGQEELLLELVEARETFARGQLDQGFEAFVSLIDLLPSDQLPAHYRQILKDCVLHMRESGQNRMEYPALAVVTLGAIAK